MLSRQITKSTFLTKKDILDYINSSSTSPKLLNIPKNTIFSDYHIDSITFSRKREMYIDIEEHLTIFYTNLIFYESYPYSIHDNHPKIYQSRPNYKSSTTDELLNIHFKPLKIIPVINKYGNILDPMIKKWGKKVIINHIEKETEILSPIPCKDKKVNWIF